MFNPWSLASIFEIGNLPPFLDLPPMSMQIIAPRYSKSHRTVAQDKRRAAKARARKRAKRLGQA